MRKDEKGFTLIELIVSVGILGLLAAIAIPMYSDYRKSAYRSAAKAALVEGAQNMERYFTRFNSYDDGTTPPTVGDPATGDQILEWTEGNRYQLSIEANDATTFTLRATPQDDDKCGYLEITQTGAKSSEIAGNCW